MKTNRTAAKVRKMLTTASWCLIAVCLVAAPVVATVSWLAALSLVSTASMAYILLDD